MLQQINHYLFQYKSVVIPEVGTFELSTKAASLDVANQAMLPPQLSVQHTPGQVVDQHLLATLAPAFENDPEMARAALQDCGHAFKNITPAQPFHWTGIGSLSVSEQGRFVLTEHAASSLLTPVAAQKVLRENVQHNVLVGDQVVQYSAEDFEAGYQEEAKRSPAIITAWVLAMLAILFIVYQLYASRLAPEGSGLRWKPAIGGTPVQHQQPNP